jgi:hypothetical protein
LTEIQKAIEQLAQKKKRSFATGSMGTTLLWNVWAAIVQERLRQITPINQLLELIGGADHLAKLWAE